MSEVIVCCGMGGVGKTTLSAALAIQHGLKGKRVAVLTIDPAKRLADSMNLKSLSNKPTKVPLPNVSVDAMMLDQAETFDEFTKKHASNEESADALLANRYYQFASRRMSGVLEYMAMIKLLDLVESGNYDVIVLDTPPNQNAIDFLEAPEKIEGLLEKSAIKWLASQKKGWRALAMGAEVVARGLQTFLGSEMIEEIGVFFEHFTTVGSQMHRQAMKCKEKLLSDQSRFYLVTSTKRRPEDIMAFHQYLDDGGYPIAGFLINRSCQPLANSSQSIIEDTEIAQVYEWTEKMISLVHRQQAFHLSRLEPLAHCHLVPEMTSDINQLQGLMALSSHLPSVAMSALHGSI